MSKISSYGLWVMGYGLTLLFLAIYSYSQIDLNLTLSPNPAYQRFQQTMIQLGYFNRPLSAAIFIVLIFLFSIFYFLFLWLVKKNKLSEKQIYLLVGLTVVVLLLSYPAFSHDIFNYMFDARIVTHYGLSPYQYRALDFPADLWIRFMHWTHRYYPYGPGWLILTLPSSWLGFGKFTLTLLNFKLLFSTFYLGNTWLINRILAKINPGQRLLGIIFFAVNPLVIVESLVSPHNEAVMLFFLLLAIYLLIKKNKWLAIISLLTSGGIKFLTLVFLPIFWLWKDKNWTKLITLLTWILLVSLIPVILYREPYPWYFITLVGLVALLIENRFLPWLTVGISLGTILRYTPFLYFGDYQSPVPQIQFWLTVLPVVFLLAIFVWRKNLLKRTREQ